MNRVVTTNALSIDVEEYFQVSAFERLIPRANWQDWPSRVEPTTEKLLDRFAVHDVKATFFTLGWIAERFPGLVRRIVDGGHELACHGYEHVRIHEQDVKTLRDDLNRSKRILEDVGGVGVIGYRAASFSINNDNRWAFKEIEAAGFEYSASIYPIKHDLYGMPEASRTPFRPQNTDRLIEIPVTTSTFLGRNLPAGGGGYFRLFPYCFSRYLIRRVNRKEGIKANMYFHPWEFDPDQPRPPGLDLKTQFRHYLNQGRGLDRLNKLLIDFSWGPFREVYASEIAGARSGQPDV